jgi:hypothetical protein
MKLSSLRSLAAGFATFVFTTGLAQAHPGHSVFDPTVMPHAGHLGEHATFIAVIAVASLGCVAHWMAKRNR